MFRRRRFTWLVLCLAFGVTGTAGQTEERPEDARPERQLDRQSISVLVRDNQGLGIAGARMELDGLYTATTDSAGMAVFNCQHNLPPVATLKVNAIRFKSCTVEIALTGDDTEVVELERADPESISTESRVNVQELSPTVARESARLQRQASKALLAHDYLGAEKLLKEALQLTPSSSAVCNNLGIAYLQARDLDGAAVWFEKAVEAAPYDPVILGNLALVRWAQARTEESYRLLVRADSLGYASAAGHFILGLVSLQQRRWAKAVKHLKMTPETRFPLRDLYLSIALRSCGTMKEADQKYRSFLKRYRVGYMQAVVSR
jgi:tetratricopeptide (TPR) repeat protein